MSETRLESKKHKKNSCTVFPSDFFVNNRTSDPKQNCMHPKVGVNVGAKGKNLKNESSPKKSPNISDSTSAISKENETEEFVKFPRIGRGRRLGSGNEFSFPFKPTPEAKKISREVDYSGVKPGRISEGTKKKAKELSPKRLLFRGHEKVSFSKVFSPQKEAEVGPGSPQSIGISRNENVENSMAKSKSMARYLFDEGIKEEGYGTDR